MQCVDSSLLVKMLKYLHNFCLPVQGHKKCNFGIACLPFIQTLADCASKVAVGVWGRMWEAKTQEESGITNLIKYRGIVTTQTVTRTVRKCVGSVFIRQNQTHTFTTLHTHKLLP